MSILRRLFRRGSVDDDIREELEAHLAMRAELNEASGMTPEEARHAARRQFGNTTAVQERLHDFNGFGWFDTVSGDVVYAVRGFRRSLGLSLTAVLTIAIGVGAVASMFGIMRSLLLAPPPYVADPDRVMRLHQLFPPAAERQDPPRPMGLTSYPFYERMAVHATTLEGVAAYQDRELAAGSGPEARMTRAVVVSAGFWRTLGVNPALGRFMTDAEAHPATGSRVVVLGHAFWRGRFGGRTDAVGQTLRIKGNPYEIIGVAPRGFRGVERADVDLWLPLFVQGDGDARAANWHSFGTSYNLRVVMRLKAGVTEDQAVADLTALQRVFLVDTYTSVFKDPARLERYRQARVLLGPLTGGLGDDLRRIPEARVTTWLVGIAVILVAVSCANVAGLLLLRAMRRRREIALRLALGVSRTRLACQLLTESTVLACAGGLAALAMIVLGGAWLQRTILPQMAWEPSVMVDPGVLAVTVLSTLAAALVAGIAPLSYACADVLPGLREAGPGALVRRPRLQSVLLAVQVSFSIVLLVGAGLFVRSVRNVEGLDIGLDRDGVLAVSIDFSGTGRSVAEVATFFERARDRASAIPGVARASLSRNIPLRVASGGGAVRLPGREAPLTQSGGGTPYVNYVTPGFFETTGMRMLQGREFVDADRLGGRAMIVNATMATAGWPDGSPIGECVYLGKDQACTTIVGVVADAVRFNILDEPRHLYYYRPLDATEAGPRALLIRMTPGVGRIDADIRRALLDLEPNLPFVRIETMGAELDDQVRPWHLGASVFTAFATLAIVLALVGLFSAVSYGVSQRVPEFAVRLALGAKRSSLVTVVVRDGLRHAVTAVVAGLLVAAVASRFIADLLYEVSPHDPAVFASIAIGVPVVAALASVLPARRAVRIQPVDALRAD
jgi:putative ABC transport system permease protein